MASALRHSIFSAEADFKALLTLLASTSIIMALCKLAVSHINKRRNMYLQISLVDMVMQMDERWPG